MMMNPEDCAMLIRQGKTLLIAGDEKLLKQLPAGEWIGGSIPYFMDTDGGLMTEEKLQVTPLSGTASIRFYRSSELANIPKNYPSNGLSFVIIPAFSGAHEVFAKECSEWDGLFDRPLVGWISGLALKDVDHKKAIVVNGRTLEISDSKAVVLHLTLPTGVFAKANIINLFEQGEGDRIEFLTKDFEIVDCKVNGLAVNFHDYVVEKGLDTRLPLVANYMGASINVSFQSLDSAKKKVRMYAPVFEKIEYRLASPVGDYESEFNRKIDGLNAEPIFTCNCVLNYVHANLEGKRTHGFQGPITFGEIAYMLLNQTLVYVTLESGLIAEHG